MKISDNEKIMDKGKAIQADRYDLFPTTVITYRQSSLDINEGLRQFFLEDPFYQRPDQAEKSDTVNLCELSTEVSEIKKLETFAVNCLKHYCKEVSWSGDFDVDMQMFANVARAGHHVPSHNHVAHIAAVYYISTPQFHGETVEIDPPFSEYWKTQDGALILHDPRFNASLFGGWEHFARVHPTPGLLVMFPAFLWHSVTPHLEQDPRLSIAINFMLLRTGAQPPRKRLRVRVE